MEGRNVLVSINADTSRIEEKLQGLLEVLPEHLPDELIGMLTSLCDKIVLMDGPVTVGAGSALDIICVLDFDATAYDQIVTAARACELNTAHFC